MEIPSAESVTAEDFEERVINSDLPVLVDFHRHSCLPCQQLAPTIDQLAQEFRGRELDKIHVYKCEDEQLFEKYKVQFVPQLILFNAGKDHWIDRGIRTMEGLRKEVREILRKP